jgi:hypothetical protein
MPTKLKTWLALALFATVTALVVWKIVPRQHSLEENSSARWAMKDFYIISYLPAQILREGESPYGQVYIDRHHDHVGYPPFSPLLAALHVPLTYLPFSVAGWMNFALQVGFTFALALLSLRLCRLPWGWTGAFLIASAIVVSRPGYTSLFLGQFIPLLVIGTYIALHYGKSRPVVAALGLFVLSLKAQFFIPVALFLLVRGNFRALVTGTALSALGAVLPLLWIAYHQGGVSSLVQDLWANYGERNLPVLYLEGTRNMRMDLGDTLIKFLDVPVLSAIASVCLLVFGCYYARKSSADEVTSPRSAILLAVILLSIYHCAYDAMLLVLPVVALFSRKVESWGCLHPLYRLGIMAMLAFPLLNHLVYQIPVRFEYGSMVWALGTSLNTFAVVVALILLGFALARAMRES